MLKVLVCGPRDWVDQKPVEDVLRLFPKGTVVIHGGQTGIDNIAGFAAKILGLTVRAYPVNHKLDGPWPGAGPRRNMRMLAEESPYEPDGSHIDLGIGFKRQLELTSGTGNMLSLLRAGDIPVWEVWYQKGEWAMHLESLRIQLEEALSF